MLAGLDKSSIFNYKSKMEFILDDYIDRYIQDADNEVDKEIARHLKEIIPRTTHLDKNVFNEILEALKKEMDNGKDFKTAFLQVCREYGLVGDIIKAALPQILTRVILNETQLIMKISRNRAIPISRGEISDIVRSESRKKIDDLFNNLRLGNKRLIFATFDENTPEADPFEKYTLSDIINMLALDRSAYKDNQVLRAAKIRYGNQDNVFKRFPVFTDAGWYDKFHPSEKHDKYGRTKPLDKSAKSMPEVVHENLKMSDVIVDIRFLEEEQEKEKRE
jgi:hypothetical protein